MNAALQTRRADNSVGTAYAIDAALTKTDIDQAFATLQPRLTRELGPISVLARAGEILFSDPARFLDERYFRFKKDTRARVEHYFDEADENEAWN